jgi:hypothetical protein
MWLGTIGRPAPRDDRAALIYQHATRHADRKIADALDTRIKAERPGDDDDDGAAGALVPVA